MYNTLEELRVGASQRGPRVFESKWVVRTGGRPRPFHGLAMYVVFSQSAEGPWETSNLSFDKPCTNW
jgi:hypothetical protein